MKIQWVHLAAALLLGMLMGAAFGPFIMFRHPPGMMLRGRMPERMLDRFAEKLDLTPEQKARVGGIFEANRPKMDALLAESRAKFDEVRKAASRQIREILTPEQRKKMDALEEKMVAGRRGEPFPPPR